MISMPHIMRGEIPAKPDPYDEGEVPAKRASYDEREVPVKHTTYNGEEIPVAQGLTCWNVTLY